MDELLQESNGFSLNIVATPAASREPVAKKKLKNNKYERRRARAAKSRKVDSRKNSVKPEASKYEESEKEPEATKSAESDKEPELVESQSDDESATDVPGDMSSVPQEKAKNVQKRDNLQDPEERAKYMAEFHARPLELDRRFGATTKYAISSKDSAHLFATSAEWPSKALHPRLLNTLITSGWNRPTTIQARAMSPFLHTDDNVMIHSETGSGKTLAFFVPILHHLASKDRKSRCEGTHCVILCPTRELAVQTFDLVETLCNKTFNWIVCGQLLGEEKRKSEKARIRKGLTVIVATPGRFLDHLTRTECLLPALTSKGPLEWLVLDEADRLLDMGLGEQVKSIFSRIQQEAQSKTWRCVLVSATVTSGVEELAHKTLFGKSANWVRIRASEDDNKISNTGKDEKAGVDALLSSTPRQLAHHHVTVTAKMRLAALVAFLAPRRNERTVVFMSTCASVDFHHALLTKIKSLFGDDSAGIFGSDCNILKLHGNVPHSERQHVLKRFLKENQGAILLATDVAARGLNLPNVDWTVQYDPPSEVSDYVHRAGRVARAGKAGNSLIFLLPSEKLFLDVLKRQGIKNMNALSLTETLNAAAKCCSDLTSNGMRRSSGGLGSTGKGPTGSRMGEAFCWEVQHRLEECVNENPKQATPSISVSKKRKKTADNEAQPETLLDIAKNAFVSHLRAYPTREKVVRQIFASKSLHLGHVARSFGLKEPPSRISNKKRKTQPEVDARKNNAAFDFNASQATPDSKSSKGKVTPKSRLFENASRLERNGMDAF